MSVESIKFPSGHSIPQLGLGTWLGKPGEVGPAVREALEVGYRHIDCAMAYNNQAEVGKAFNETFQGGKIKREEVFVTSKIWNVFHSYKSATEAVDIILRDLQLTYLDLCLIHWPQAYIENAGLFPKDKDGVIIPDYSIDFMETWRAMEEAKKAGKIRSLGVSNFNPQQVERIINEGTVKIDNLQLEAHPYYPQENAINFCKKHGIVMTSYSPLANPGHMFRKEGQANLLVDPTMLKIAQSHNKTVAQVAIRWALQRGTVCIPKSTNRNRMEENFNVFDFTLTPQEMAEILGLDQNLHLLPLDRDLDHPYYPFKVPF